MHPVLQPEQLCLVSFLIVPSGHCFKQFGPYKNIRSSDPSHDVHVSMLALQSTQGDKQGLQKPPELPKPTGHLSWHLFLKSKGTALSVLHIVQLVGVTSQSPQDESHLAQVLSGLA